MFSQHQRGGSQLSVTLERADALFSPPKAPWMHTVHIHPYRQAKYSYTLKIFLNTRKANISTFLVFISKCVHEPVCVCFVYVHMCMGVYMLTPGKRLEWTSDALLHQSPSYSVESASPTRISWQSLSPCRGADTDTKAACQAFLAFWGLPVVLHTCMQALLMTEPSTQPLSVFEDRVSYSQSWFWTPDLPAPPAIWYD